MDGLLVDSEKLWHQAELEILGALGCPIPVDNTRQTKGMYVGEVVQRWFERSPWDGPTTDEVVEQILDRVGELATEQDCLLPGVHQTLELVGEAGMTRVLASSTPHRLIERILGHYDLRSSFVAVCSAQDERYGKPNPAVFLTAAHEAGAVARRCVVFEDAPAGVLAAKAATMVCVAVPEPAEAAHKVIAIADVVLGSLLEFTPEVLAGLQEGL